MIRSTRPVDLFNTMDPPEPENPLAGRLVIPQTRMRSKGPSVISEGNQ
ncbi:hypothetical protein ACFWXO_18575 [Kitasatospora sp. NPDC059088]